MIGKGGSSRVFRVLNHASELFAIKRVTLDKIDPDTMNGFMNEIALLKRLEGNSRIIRLFDSEVKPGPGGSKGHLLLVMECGEVDLNRLLQEQMKEPVNMVWVAYYWQQVCSSYGLESTTQDQSFLDVASSARYSSGKNCPL